ncbi:glycoside hydrolase family 53 protein [Thermogemmatispora tikiterensis]|nr:arabinogalactan endo-1,4-beta-galactosidase [Thermogemmatispora tikiterensis]
MDRKEQNYLLSAARGARSVPALWREHVSRRRFLGQMATATALAGGLTLGGGLPAALAAPHPAPRQSGRPRPRVLGHDLSTLQQLEDVGKHFSDHGRVLPAEQIVAHHGATFIRERLWVQPPIPYNDLPHILTMAHRIKAAGLHFLLDFHYSDFWADPSHQTTPQSWQGQDLATLAQTVYDYTRSVLGALARQGTLPEMVQTGNEVTAGMLWPQGQIYVNGTERWPQFATLLKAAIAAVRDTSRSIEVMVHIDRGGDNAGSRYFFDHILAQGVDFDVIGLSYYPWWHGPLSALQANLNDLAPRYGKDLVVVETAYPWTLTDGDSEPNIVNAQTPLLPGYPPTPEGQLAYIRTVRAIVEGVPQGRGRGLVYWESAWIPGVGWEPGAGDAWDNMTLFDRQGRALPSIRCYQ